MPKSIIFCEGKRDSIFFEKYISDNTNDIRVISADKKDASVVIQRLSRCRYEIVLIPCGGIDQLYEFATDIIHQLVYEYVGEPSSCIIIGDSDRFDHEKIIKYMKETDHISGYKPIIQTKSCIIEMNYEDNMKQVLLLDTPHNLEKEIVNELKNMHPRDRKLRNFSDFHDAIDYAVDKYYNGREKDLIVDMAKQLNNKDWLTSMLDKLRRFDIIK
jgi:hypothetical protein